MRNNLIQSCGVLYHGCVGIWVGLANNTEVSHNLIRDLQIGRQGSGVQLMPGEERPTLPPLEELLKEADEGGM